MRFAQTEAQQIDETEDVHVQNTMRMELGRNWLVAWDRENTGKEAGWPEQIPDEAVPAVFPGLIADSIPEFCRGVGWFWNRFDLEQFPGPEEEADLLLGYTEYLAEYWLNGNYVGRFEGVQLNYEFEVTPHLRQGENLLAVRIVSPTKEGIDGFYLGRETNLNHPQNNIVNRHVGSNIPFGGIRYPVRIAFRPKIRCSRIVTLADWTSGALQVTAELLNRSGAPAEADVSLTVFGPDGEMAGGEKVSLSVQVGGGSHTFTLTVRDPRLWSTDEPNLYSAQVAVRTAGTEHVEKTDFGFRNFCIRNGYFYLNGKRIFLKSCNYAFTPTMESDGHWSLRDGYRDIAYLRSLGYQMFRFLTGNPFPEFIDMCNKAGALIQEETAASWGMSEENPNLEEQMAFHLVSAVRRDVNAPSVVSFGILNEMLPGRVTETAKKMLPLIRREAPNLLVFFNSGRFDLDMGQGSASNPYSDRWEHVFGGERPDGRVLGDIEELYERIGVNLPEVGDVHVYPDVPVSWRDVQRIRNYGKGYLPSACTEGNIGSFGNQMAMVRRDEQKRGPGVPPSAAMRNVIRRAERFERDFYRFGLGDVYASPDDLSYWACHANAQQKRLYFQMIRSNSQFASFNPGLVDGGHGNNVVDPSHMCTRPYVGDVTMECMSELLWCLFVNPMNVYAGQEFLAEAVLASEDALKPGEYPVTARIASTETGCVWEHRTVLTVPEPPEGGCNPLAFPVFSEMVHMDVPEGDYELRVWIERGAQPAGGCLMFRVTAPVADAEAAVSMRGLDGKTRAWLEKKGVRDDSDASVLLIGDVPNRGEAWEEIWEHVFRGASAIFLKPEVFVDPAENAFDSLPHVPKRLPLSEKGFLTYAESWYYHPIEVLRRHPFCRDLPKGILHDDYWGGLTPQFVFDGQEIPDEIASVTLAVPYLTSVHEYDGYLIGTSLGTYRYGQGKIILNCFKITETLGEHPAADRLLMNIIRTSVEQAGTNGTGAPRLSDEETNHDL